MPATKTKKKPAKKGKTKKAKAKTPWTGITTSQRDMLLHLGEGKELPSEREALCEEWQSARAHLILEALVNRGLVKIVKSRKVAKITPEGTAKIERMRG